MVRYAATLAFGVAVLLTVLLRPVPANAGPVRFSRRVVDPNGPNWATDRGMHVKAVGDLNGDDHPELIVAGSLLGEPLIWYGWPTWSRNVISTLGGWSTDAEVGDIDQDGDLDVAISSWYRTDAGLEWFENPGAGSEWVRHTIGSPRAHDLSLVDLDGDGDLDIVSRDQEAAGNKLQFWRQDSPTSWSRRTLTGIPAGEGLAVADLDNDGDTDVIIAGAWLENTLDILGGPWTMHPYTSTWTVQQVVAEIADLNGDGRPDIILAPSEPAGESYRISWFESPPDPLAPAWTEHVVEPVTETVMHSLQARDFDRDGDIELLTAEMHQSRDPDEIAIYFNDGTPGTGASFTRQVIDGGGAHNIEAADFDGDGYDDFFGPNWTGTQVVDVWMNRFRLAPLDFNEDGVVDSADLHILISCGTGPSVPYDALQLPAGCDVVPDDDGLIPPDLDHDGDVDTNDFGILQVDLQLVD